MSSGRKYKQCLEQFDQLSSLLKRFAEENNGSFNPRPEFPIEDIESLTPPFLYYFLEKLFQQNPEKDKEQFERTKAEIQSGMYPRVGASVPYKQFQILFEMQPAETAPSLFLHCGPKLVSCETLTLERVSSGPISNPTGGSSAIPFPPIPPRYLSPIIPRKFLELSSKDSKDTYFCPFVNPELQKTFALRSSKVSFGNRFADDNEIAEILVEVRGLTGLEINGYAAQLLGEQYLFSIIAGAQAEMRQFRLLLDLMKRTLDLADEHGLLAD